MKEAIVILWLVGVFIALPVMLLRPVWQHTILNAITTKEEPEEEPPMFI